MTRPNKSDLAFTYMSLKIGSHDNMSSLNWSSNSWPAWLMISKSDTAANILYMEWMHAENKYFNKTSFYVHALLSMTVLSTRVTDHIIWWRSYSKMKFIDLFLAISQRNWELPWCINLLPVSACSLRIIPATPALGVAVTKGSCNRNNPGPFTTMTTLLFYKSWFIRQCIICWDLSS